MRLSAPVYQLKRKARLLSRADNIPLHEALDRIAAEGLPPGACWWRGCLPVTPAAKLFEQLSPGDLVLVGARPGHGKTLMSLKLAVEAMQIRPSQRVLLAGIQLKRTCWTVSVPSAWSGRVSIRLFEFDNSDDISADYVARKLADAPRGTLVVIDYLQLLDQKRENPALMVQVRALQSFARERGLIFVFISQIHRSYDPAVKPCPDLDDVRLPNPVDLGLFSKTCFLNNGDIRFQAAR